MANNLAICTLCREPFFSCDCECRRYKDTTTPEQRYHLTLNQYQRDNLLWLLQLCGYPDERSLSPFKLAHTGDWLGEIHNMLGDENGKFDPIKPNRTVGQMRDLVEKWNWPV